MVLYSADYDMYQVLNLNPQSLRAFVHHVAKLQSLPNTHILDIKIGEVQDWNLLLKPSIEGDGIVGYQRKKELEHLSMLRNSDVITEKEYTTAKKLLPLHMTPLKLIEARKELRFGLLRWTPIEVLKGYKMMRNGKRITLQQAVESTGITKIDLISWINNKYNEFSNVIIWNGFTEIANPIESIKENVLLYLDEKNYFKLLKRVYSLAKLTDDTDVQERCLTILNSEIGFLYTIVADLEILEQVKTENLTKSEKRKVKQELGELTDKIAKVYFPGNKRAKRATFSLLPKLYSILQDETRKAMDGASLLPIPDTYLP